MECCRRSFNLGLDKSAEQFKVKVEQNCKYAPTTQRKDSPYNLAAYSTLATCDLLHDLRVHTIGASIRQYSASTR